MPGSTVQLHAIPAPGWRFSGWQGGLAGVANPATLTISANQQVTATFVQQQYSITTRVVDGDGMVVNAGAITLSPPVDGIGYRYGESVTLTLTLPSGWTFIGWAEPIADKELVTTITVTDDLTVNAVIAPQHYALTVQVVDAVEKPQSTSLLAYSAPQDGIGYRFGEVVTLTPKEANGWRFDHWSGDLNGTAAPATLTMDADKQIVAHFIKRQYQLTLSVGGQGSAVGGHVELDPKGPYDYGQVVTLTAVADPGYQFISWVISPTVEAQVEGADSPSTSPIITVTMTTDFTYQAQFQAVADIRIYLPVIQR
ncbi:MAG: hypothetical protein R2932_25205 [Caldilineaceae bacterium]